MATSPIDINGTSLSLGQLVQLARNTARARFTTSAKIKVRRARAVVEKLARGKEHIYGVNTGFGALAEVSISPDQIKELQSNLVKSHATGVGEPLSEAEARALIALRANVLAKGFSGVRTVLVELLLSCLNKNVLPWVPRKGSVGASGDLAPLAHLATLLTGDGWAMENGKRLPARTALKKAGLKPLVLEAKEGLSLINGTQAMCAVGGLSLDAALDLALFADAVGALSLEGLKGSAKPFDARIANARGFRGQLESATNLRKLLAKSEIMHSHAHCGKVQDPYSFRCMPQVHGASRDALHHARKVLEREFNSATDNPLVFTAQNELVSGGNFHGQPVALALDYAAIGAAELGSISERRVEHLLNPALSGLPPFLAHDSGLHSGFMITQVTAAALVSENKLLAMPASVDSIPSSANREDHVSMGMNGANKLARLVENLQNVLAIEWLVAAQAVEFHRPLKPARGAFALHQFLRKHVEPLKKDRFLAPDIETAAQLIEVGGWKDALRASVGALHR